MRHLPSNVKLIKSVIMKMELALSVIVQMDIVATDVLVNAYNYVCIDLHVQWVKEVKFT